MVYVKTENISDAEWDLYETALDLFEAKKFKDAIRLLHPKVKNRQSLLYHNKDAQKLYANSCLRFLPEDWHYMSDSERTNWNAQKDEHVIKHIQSLPISQESRGLMFLQAKIYYYSQKEFSNYRAMSFLEHMIFNQESKVTTARKLGNHKAVILLSKTYQRVGMGRDAIDLLTAAYFRSKNYRKFDFTVMHFVNTLYKYNHMKAAQAILDKETKQDGALSMSIDASNLKRCIDQRTKKLRP